VRWTIKDGIVYDARQLAADVARMVEEQKRSRPAAASSSQPDGAGDPHGHPHE
jgi:hypothetical protein